MKQDIDLIVVPYHVGHHRVSVGRGSEAILARGAVASLEAIGRRVQTRTIELGSGQPNDVVASFNLQKLVSEEVLASIERQALPIALTGNCNTAAIGMIGGLPRAIGVIWFDAHADFETPETTLWGFQDDMGLAIATGYCWQGMREHVAGAPAISVRHVVLVGTRDCTASEQRRLSASAVRSIGPDQMRSSYPGEEFQEALDVLGSGVDGVYVHIDLDVLDSSWAKANAYAAPGGLAVTDLSRAISAIGATMPILGAAITAYDPELDADYKVADAAVDVFRVLATAAN